MIKLFRKIRYEILTKSNFGKYVYYAVGEVILVVIGILIALQVNNWNELRKVRQQETQLIENLKSEVHTNLVLLKEVKDNNESILNCTHKLLTLIGAKDEILIESNTDSLIFQAILIGDFQPIQFVLSGLRTEKNLEIIRSEDLKRLLFEWDKELSIKTETFNMLNTYFMNSLIPFLDEKISMANIDYYGNNRWSRKTLLKTDSFKIFEMMQFENRLENHIWCINAFSSSIDRLIALSEIIIEQIVKDTIIDK